jgi:cGMP-dependent protein kinase interacting domain
MKCVNKTSQMEFNSSFSFSFPYFSCKIKNYKTQKNCKNLTKIYVKQLQKYKQENERLRAENRALTRVVSKLTTSAQNQMLNKP